MFPQSCRLPHGRRRVLRAQAATYALAVVLVLLIVGMAAPVTATAAVAAASAPPATAATAAILETGPVAAVLERALADTFALAALRELCDEVGPRLAGSEGMRRAHQWAKRWLVAAGTDTIWTQPVTVPRWERGREWARLVEPYAIDLGMLGLGMSVGTGGRPLVAEVLAVTDWDELEARAAEAAGRIVLFNPPWTGYGPNVQYRSQAARRAAQHGAVAALIRPAGFGQNTPHTGVMSYADDGPRIPAASLTEEGAALLWRLDRAGRRPTVSLYMEAEPLEPGPCANVIGELRGRERPGEIVLIGAHLDAWDTGQGAHDDGAACALMIAALKVLHDLELRPRRTVRVVLFTSEEYGGQGGRAYAEAYGGDDPRHVLALESDSGCFAPAGFSVRAAAETIEALRPFAAPLATVGADTLYPGWAGVDIGPLVETGVIGIGHRVHGREYFRYHHGPADVLTAVAPADLAANLAAVAGFIYGVADFAGAELAPAPAPRTKDD
jgi:carboxypeptidase Q